MNDQSGGLSQLLAQIVGQQQGAPALNPTAIPQGNMTPEQAALIAQMTGGGAGGQHPLAAFAQHVMKQRQRPQGFMWRGQFHPYGGQRQQRMHPLHQALISAMAPPETGGVRPPAQGVPGFDPTTGAFTGPAASQGVRAPYAGQMPTSGYSPDKGAAERQSIWPIGVASGRASVRPRPGIVGVGFEM